VLYVGLCADAQIQKVTTISRYLPRLLTYYKSTVHRRDLEWSVQCGWTDNYKDRYKC